MVKRETVLASGLNDSKGYRSTNLNDGDFYYAELSKDPFTKPNDFSALGDLPYKISLEQQLKKEIEVVKVLKNLELISMRMLSKLQELQIINIFENQ
ncbi:unnamed protein product [Paramecium sonneborni]|uniref:Uncharacterized protein n=1 Tax=Paramecium sonneborni TaxID=65129 RepID=A0A8S1RBN9_9CILI|nr:unnamed protein product [Paramecium sonneborni]